MQAYSVMLCVVVALLLTGCAHFDWTFNREQQVLDQYRHARGSIEQGRWP
jgi:hypothetical protein